MLIRKKKNRADLPLEEPRATSRGETVQPLNGEKNLKPKVVKEIQPEATQSLDSANNELFKRMQELQAANAEILQGRRVALNIMEDALLSREALRASEEKYRTLFNSIDEGFHIIELIYDELGHAVDYRFVEVNLVSEQQTGLKDVVGKLRSEVLPNTESFWIEEFDRVVKTGKSSRFENYHEVTERWYTAYVSRIGGAEHRQAAVVFNDITERKLNELRQEFLLKLSDTLRPLFDTAQIQGEACRLLGEHLQVDNAFYPEIKENEGWARVEQDYTSGKTPSVAGFYPLENFRWFVNSLQKGEIAVLEDRESPGLIPQAEREALAAIHIRALISVPLVKDGVWVAAFTLTQATPRKWKTDEIDLARDTAERIWDTIERARAEKALRESEENLRGVANIAPDLLWHSEPDGSTKWYNQRWFEYTGQTKTEAGAWGLIEAIHPDDREISAYRYLQAVEKGQSLQQEYRIRDAAGDYRWFLVRAEPLLDEQGRITRMYGAATDIQEQRARREELAERVRERTLELSLANYQLAEINKKLKGEQERLRMLSLKLLEVQESERRYLARELHDEIGQYLTGLKFMLESGNQLTLKEQKTKMADTLTTVDELTVKVRDLSLNLRPTLLDDMGLIPALATHFQRYTAQTQIEVKFIHRGLENRLAPEIETTVYRVVQEALTNVARHAQTSKVLVQIVVNEQLMLLIQDEGQGFAVEAKLEGYQSTGLSAMRERVELVGGNFTIESETNYGTTIMAQIPINSLSGKNSLS